ncbi:acyl carrier protein [Actinomadura sp. 7K507]|uniref:acyl carrier protein n=1 Tax=Actinomadura sp. 7K507 TaxID=2530365 RepID=UPI001052B6FB|nr:acyl carrier protein [Actinomadura sp. 7K507]TDC97198.1 acyl carrier protein [Actinomadura sp. 7K507]
MNQAEFKIDDLRRVLTEAAGTPEEVDLEDDILDMEFDVLGYDSLALQETGSRVERAYGIELEDEAIVDARTPREFLSTVNMRLADMDAG